MVHTLHSCVFLDSRLHQVLQNSFNGHFADGALEEEVLECVWIRCHFDSRQQQQQMAQADGSAFLVEQGQRLILEQGHLMASNKASTLWNLSREYSEWEYRMTVGTYLAETTLTL